MKNEPKSLESVKEPCMECLFAVRPERWRRFRGVVYIGKGRRKKKEVKMRRNARRYAPCGAEAV